MQDALADFYNAYASGSAPTVAAFLSPIPPPQNPGRLYDILRTTNEARVGVDVQYAVESRMRRHMSPAEISAWVDILSCYWRGVDRIVKYEQAENQGKLAERQAFDVYDTWKDLTNSFIKYISNGALPYWTVFTLYFTANHLRRFALKADAQIAKAKPVAFSSGFQDDIVSTNPRNEKLEEAARVFNRIFALCLGDRNPDLSSSRKWGVYCIANLQFKTYFKVNPSCRFN